LVTRSGNARAGLHGSPGAARYRARSGPALAALSLSTLIAVIICVASAARFGNVLDYAGPNLTSSQLIVYAPIGNVQTNGSQQIFTGATAAQMAAGVKTAKEIAADLGTTGMIALDTSSVGLQHASPGRSWNGQIYVATPQLLKAFGISPCEINPDADILTMRPGLSTTRRGATCARWPRPGRAAPPAARSRRRPRVRSGLPAPWLASWAATSRRSASSAAIRSTACRR
jgi:hypothetical protein